MDFIGNLLNQMSSAFNQETAIPKKEEISMDETLKWRALKNNQFASRTRGGAASGTRSGSSVGRRSARGTSNGQQAHPQLTSSENSNDSIDGTVDADGMRTVLSLDEDANSSSALLATNGGRSPTPYGEEDIEIEIAKDISGEELQEALGLSQLVEVKQMEVDPMEELVEPSSSMVVNDGDQQQEQKNSGPLTVEKQDPNGGETLPDKKITITPPEGSRKLENKSDVGFVDRDGGCPNGIAKLALTDNPPLSALSEMRDVNDKVTSSDCIGGNNDRDDGTGDREKELAAKGSSSKFSISGIAAGTVAADEMHDHLAEGGQVVEIGRSTTPTEDNDRGAIGKIETEDPSTADVEEDDDDVVIISIGDMADVVEVAETSKEEDNDEEEEEKEEVLDGEQGSVTGFPPAADERASDHDGSTTRTQEEVKEQNKDPKLASVVTSSENIIDEAEEKYRPIEIAGVKIDVSREEIEHHTSDDAKMKGANVTSPSTASNEPRIAPGGEVMEVEQKHDPEKQKPEKEGIEVEEKVCGEDRMTSTTSLSTGRTTRSKKAVTVVVPSTSSGASAAAVMPSQRRSQRFQAKDATLPAGGRKSIDAKLNGESQTELATIIVKEEDLDDGTVKKRSTAAGEASLKEGAVASAAGEAKVHVKGSPKALAPSLERSVLTVKSDRSLRSRQQSTNSTGVGSGSQPTTVVTRRSSETVKSRPDESAEPDETNEDKLSRRGRKRLSQEPSAPVETSTVALSLPAREKATREAPSKNQESARAEQGVATRSGFPLDPGENDTGGKQQSATQVQRRGRKRKTQNPADATAVTGTSSTSPEKPPPFKRAARVSRDGSDGILASALARRDKVDSQGRLSRPIKLSAKMLANEELRHGFEQHNNGRIFIGSDAPAGYDESAAAVVLDRDRDRDHRLVETTSSEKSRKQSERQQQQQHQEQTREVNLPPANSAISSSSEDVMVVSVTYPEAKPTGSAGSRTKGSLYQVGKGAAGRALSERKPAASATPSASAGPSKRPAQPASTSVTLSCPDIQTFLQEIRSSRICTNRSPEDSRKLNRRQTKRLAKLKEKYLLGLGLQRKGIVQSQRNGAADSRKNSVEMEAELLSDVEPESESSGSETDFVPAQKIGTVGKPSVTLRLRKSETLLENRATTTGKANHLPLVTVPSAMVREVVGGRQPASISRHQGGNRQATNSRISGRASASSRRSSAAVVLPAAMTTASATATSHARPSSSDSVPRKDRETEELQQSLIRLGCQLTLIPTTTPPSSDGRSSSSSSHTVKAGPSRVGGTSTTGRRKEPAGSQRPQQRQWQRSPVRNHQQHVPPSVIASTSPSLQIVLEKCPPSDGAAQRDVRPSAQTGNGTMPGGSKASPSPPLLCLCRQPSDMYVASSVGTGYCSAVDDIDGQMIGCCNELSAELVHMLRPSPTVSFQLLCNMHRKRLEDHGCCATCGTYCTQGNFAMCKNAHIFHPDCAVKYILNAPYNPARPAEHTSPTLVLQCPHCGQECPNGEIQVHIQLTTPPVLLPSRKNIVKPAKMSLGKNKSSTNGGSTAKNAFRANVESYVPSSVRNMFAADAVGSGDAVGPANGHDKRGSPTAGGGSVVGGSGIGTKCPYTTKNFFDAVHKDDVVRVTEIIFSGFDIETRFRDFHNGTCLHLVSNFGSIGMAYLIICRAQSVDFLNILDRELRTALMCAVLGSKLEIIKLLLECGADVTVKGPDGMTVLHLAAKLGQHDAVRMILEWAKKRLTARDLTAFVNGVDNGSYTALVWAAENRHKETIQQLLAIGADVNICDKENNTSLHWAAMAGCSDSMHLLLKKGCDPNVQNINGDTPLHLACRHGNGDICIMLLTTGASLNVRNASNELPQDMLRNPNSECANIIAANVKMFSLGKNTKETRILCSDISNGREYYPVQVVHTAGRNDRQQMVPQFKYIMKSVQLECHLDIDTNLRNANVCSCKDGCTSTDSTCLCSERTWYTEDGRLVGDFNFLEPPTIVECGDLCDCNHLLCRNRVVQRGLRVPLQLFYGLHKAWGVRTLVPIAKGSFLVEYVGELLTDEVANQRPNDTYFFDLNSGFCIDAHAHGNVSRFFNHSCDPNVSPVPVYYEHNDKRFPKVAMFACRDIKAQEEICFNYGEKFWMVKNRTLSCHCNANECRYRTVQQGLLD